MGRQQQQYQQDQQACGQLDETPWWDVVTGSNATKRGATSGAKEEAAMDTVSVGRPRARFIPKVWRQLSRIGVHVSGCVGWMFPEPGHARAKRQRSVEELEERLEGVKRRKSQALGVDIEAEEGDVELVIRSLHMQKDPEEREGDLEGEEQPGGGSPAAAALLQAAKQGDAAQLKRAIGQLQHAGAEGADAAGRALDRQGRTALHWAARNGHLEALELLVTSANGPSPGTRAAVGGSGSSASIDARDREGDTPLHLAALFGHSGCVALLLDVAASAGAGSQAEPGKWTPLHHAASYGQAACAELLLDRGAGDVNAAGDGGNTALHLAARGGHAACTELLMGRGAEVNAARGDGDTPLHGAACCGRAECVELLLGAGAEVDARNAAGRTALHRAAERGRKGVIEALLRGGAEVDVVDGDAAAVAAASGGDSPAPSGKRGRGPAVGVTPLHLAAGNGNESCVALLLERGADVTKRDRAGNSALHLAAQGGHVGCVAALADAATAAGGLGADAVGAGGRTALEAAGAAGQQECVQLK